MKKQALVKKSAVSMPLVNPNAAGIDVGDTIHAVAVPEGRDEAAVRTFGTMTCDLEAIAAWLGECGVETVAMESTGVYWKPLFTLLTRRGFEVYLVNAKQVKNVSGRKNDEDDARWIQKLHSCGLLRSSYLPDDQQEALRTLVRHRKALMQDRSRCVFRMQKALELMNVKLHTLLRDICGKTGLLIIEAILRGERAPECFLACIHSKVKADRATLLKSLEGNWRGEQLYLLEDAYACYRYYTERIASCDATIERQLERYRKAVRAEAEPDREAASPKRANRNKPMFNTCAYVRAVLGVDVMAIYGISDIGALEILSETGTDLGKWPTAKHFVSWLNLCPNSKISGGKLISSTLMKKKPNPASQAFRNAANSVQRSDNWLGDYFRRMKAKGGNRYAVVATANKIATIYYKMVSCQQEFNPVELTAYQNRYKQAKIVYLERRL